jgi:hypothetical protein
VIDQCLKAGSTRHNKHYVPLGPFYNKILFFRKKYNVFVLVRNILGTGPTLWDPGLWSAAHLCIHPLLLSSYFFLSSYFVNIFICFFLSSYIVTIFIRCYYLHTLLLPSNFLTFFILCSYLQTLLTMELKFPAIHSLGVNFETIVRENQYCKSRSI